MSLLKNLQPRASQQADSKIVSKISKPKQSQVTIKGGTSILDRISTITALVRTKLGKYENDYLVLREESQVVDYFDKIISNGIGSIDTETTSLDPISCTIAGICIYTPGEKPAYIPLNHISYITGVKVTNQVDVSVIKECLQKTNLANVKWIMFHACFDVRVLKNQVGIEIPCFWDGYLAARVLNQNEPANGLKALHKKYCQSGEGEALAFEDLFKGIPFTHIPISTGYLYAARDAIVTYELYLYQAKVLTRSGLPGQFYVFRYIEMPAVPATAQMEDNGVCLNRVFQQKLSEKYNAELKVREEKFYTILEMYANEIEAYKRAVPNHKLANPISMSSPPQMATLLYDILKIPPPDKKNPRGTGEEIIAKMKLPLCEAILDCRETAKLLSTYVDKMPKVLNSITNRIHANFNQYGADTGRYSSSDPNMQNIPSKNKEIRKMFEAQEGYILISCDFSQQEPRTLAHMSQDPDLLKAYTDGKDIYAWIATSIYNVPYEECLEARPDGTDNPAGKKRRDSVKSIILGIMYGRGIKSIAEQLGDTKKRAQEIIDKFFNAYPLVKKFIDATIADAAKKGYVTTAWGRRRYLPDMLLDEFEITYEGPSTNFDPLAFDESSVSREVDEVTKQRYIKQLRNTYSFKEQKNIIFQAKQLGIKIRDNRERLADAGRQCVNSIIQGSSADMTKLAMILIHNDEFLKSKGCRMLLQVHDELIAEAPAAVAAECAARISQLMIQSAKDKINVPMKCDTTLTKEWYGPKIAA